MKLTLATNLGPNNYASHLFYLTPETQAESCQIEKFLAYFKQCGASVEDTDLEQNGIQSMRIAVAKGKISY